MIDFEPGSGAGAPEAGQAKPAETSSQSGVPGVNRNVDATYRSSEPTPGFNEMVKQLFNKEPGHGAEALGKILADARANLDRQHEAALEMFDNPAITAVAQAIVEAASVPSTKDANMNEYQAKQAEQKQADTSSENTDSNINNL